VSSNWIMTHAGHSFSYDDEHIESNTYDVQDIAHSLALTCRYGGMTDYHYSVAQHSCLIAQQIWLETHDPVLCLDGLFHDAEEAYMGDMKTPLKNMMPDFRAMSKKVDKAIRRSFNNVGVPLEMSGIAREYDYRILLDERLALLPDGELWNIQKDGTRPLGVTIQKWSPEMAKGQFLHMFGFYSNAHSLSARKIDHDD